MRKYENEGNAKLGGLVKELGCQIVTQNLSKLKANRYYLATKNEAE